MRPYYSIPLQANDIINKKRHRLVEIDEAISSNIKLILKTHLTEYRYDYDYGCYVWDQDFKNIASISKWENEMENQIKSSIEKYEKRLDNIHISSKVESPDKYELNEMIPNRFKRRINILVTGEIWKIKQKFQHREFIYFSPLAIY
jgi:phage baseplate assembly protein W